MVDSFVYLDCMIHKTGSSIPEITKRITIARNSMKTLDERIWRSNISLQAKICLYNCYILPVLLYGAEVRTITDSVKKKLDALDSWCLRCVLHNHTRNTLRTKKSANVPTNLRSAPPSEAEECDNLDI